MTSIMSSMKLRRDEGHPSPTKAIVSVPVSTTGGAGRSISSSTMTLTSTAIGSSCNCNCSSSSFASSRRPFSVMSQWSVQCLLLSVVVMALQLGEIHGNGLQSGPSPGAFHAGGMFFDSLNGMLYMTGLHYNVDVDGQTFMGTAVDSQSNCFVASLELDEGFPTAFTDWSSFGEAGVMETCSALALHNPSQIVLTGSVEQGGFLSIPDPDVPLSGLVAVLDKGDLNLNKGITLTTATNPSQRLLYPMAAVDDGGDNFYIAALTSTDATVRSDLGGEGYPNWQREQKYGTSLDMTILKVSLSQAVFEGVPTGDITVEEVWTQEFPIQPESDGTIPRVYIGGLIYKRDGRGREILAVAGSTRGLGDGYGPADGDDEDGFIAVLDPSTGQLYENMTNNIREGSELDDIVTGICNDPNDPNGFFIVGATKGQIGTQQATIDTSAYPKDGLQPFIRRIKLNSLEQDWTIQWFPVPPEGSTNPASAFALDCAVSNDRDVVYVAGTVHAGASMAQGESPKPSQGGDDVWIARVQIESGAVDWLTQLGSAGDDSLAFHGGLIVNKQNNPMIYGDTTGSLYRQRDESTGDVGTSDVFVMSLYGISGFLLGTDDAFLGGTSNDGIVAPVAAPAGSPISAPVAEPPVTEPPVAEPPVAEPPVTGDPVAEPPVAGDPVIPLVSEHVFVAVGLQITGPAFAGGVVYDDVQNSVLLSGATYDSSSDPHSMCFIGIVNLDNGDLETTKTYGSETHHDACSAVVFDSQSDAAYGLGMSVILGTDGYFNQGSWTDVGSASGKAGMILQMNARGELVGGNRMGDALYTYPTAIAVHPTSTHVYVASMVSENATAVSVPGESRYQDYTGAGPKDFGSNFFLTVDRFDVSSVPADPSPAGSVPATINLNWNQRYATDSGSLEVSGMTLAGNADTLVVVGSTRYGGGPFEDNDGDDMDGWILKLDATTGELYTGPSGSERSSTRLDSSNKMDDWILDVCNDRFNNDAFYIVGATMGTIRDLPEDQQPPEGSVHAFVAKVNLENLTAIWLKHFTMTIPDGGPVVGEALSCIVTPGYEGFNIVYVAGTIKNGALMDEVTDITASHGKDDIFLASMDGETGTLNWIQQIGTPENDHLAGGQGLDVDAYGNAIVYGQTTGNMYGTHEGDEDANDLIVLTVNKIDGSYLESRTEGDGVGDQDPVTEPPASAPSDGGVVLPDAAAAMQSGPDVGPSYAGGMVYDSFTNAVYITGSTYGSFSGPGVLPDTTSKCIFGVATLPKLQWKERSVFGTETAPEACNALSLTSYNGNSEALVVGSTESTGLLTGLGAGGVGVEQYGIILDLSNQDGEFELLGGSVIEANQVQFPIHVLTNGDQVFVVSMTSLDTKVTADFEKVENDEYPNYTTGGVEKFGSQYNILIERYTISRGNSTASEVLQPTLKLEWREPFESADLEAIYVSGMILADNGATLVIVGSTRSSSGGGSMDGIMAKVSTANGSFMQETDGARDVAYFTSREGLDDWILNACPDPDDVNAFYIVGATQGSIDPTVNKSEDDLTVNALVSKIQTDTLSILWTKQFPVSQGSAMALGCSVIPGRGQIYVAGDVENGGVIDYPSDPQKSAGKDDIFVSMLETSTGNVVWLKQVGSQNDDRLARGGCIIADANGNAVVFGDTTGDLYRARSRDPNPSYSDLFLLVFDHDDGLHVPVVEGSEWYGPSSSSGKSTYLALAITAIVVLVVTLFCYCLVRRSRRKRAESQKSSIFAYLQQFDVEDIDLRKSPPGGWHGTYLNKLAYGINKAEMNGGLTEADGVTVFETAPLTHSSIVKDSLFMDNMSKPSLGYRDGTDEYGLSAASVYDDLTPRSVDDKKSVLKGREFI